MNPAPDDGMVPSPVGTLRLATLLIAVTATVLGGCKSPCRQLSEKLCECASNTVEKEDCLRRASQSENDTRFEPDDADNALCQSLLESCDCRLIDTAEGKRACGLAR